MSLHQTDLLTTISLINDTVGINTAHQVEQFWLKSQHLLGVKCLSIMVSNSNKQKDLAHADFLLCTPNNTPSQHKHIAWMQPIIKYGLLNNAVFSFEEAFIQYEAHHRHNNIIELAKHQGMYNGYAIGQKAHCLSGVTSVTAWVCDEQQTSPKQAFMAKSILPHLNETLSRINFSQAPTLSRREFEVLQQVKTGKTCQKIAETLYISTHTVNFHLKNIFQKLGVSNKTQALSSAIKLGLIEF